MGDGFFSFHAFMRHDNKQNGYRLLISVDWSYLQSRLLCTLLVDGLTVAIESSAVVTCPLQAKRHSVMIPCCPPKMDNTGYSCRIANNDLTRGLLTNPVSLCCNNCLCREEYRSIFRYCYKVLLLQGSL
jgi:hypothetical protein